MKKLLTRIQSLFKQGLFHIMGSTVINKAIAFITNIFLVRILSKYTYGVFSSAFNIFLIASLFTGFGIFSSTLYFASDKEDESTRRSVYSFALRYGLVISIVLCIAIFVYGIFGNVGIEETRQYIVSLTLLPFFIFIIDYFAIILRTRKENKKYALLLNVNSITYAILAIIGSYFFGIPGTILGRYCSYFITAIMGYVFTRKYTKLNEIIAIKKEKKEAVVRYAAFSGCVSALNNILYRIDITLISLLIANATILASYKVAAVIPESMNFIPQSILIVFLPLFIENQNNKQWIVSKAKELFKYMALVCGCITILLIAFAGIVVRLLWGVQYLDGIPYFRILAISFFFLGVFRSTSTNILQALGKVKFNLYVSIVASITNICLDILLINQYGALGAAFATLFVTIIASAMSFPYLIYTLKNYENN